MQLEDQLVVYSRTNQQKSIETDAQGYQTSVVE
jgi:hypothetical protein